MGLYDYHTVDDLVLQDVGRVDNYYWCPDLDEYVYDYYQEESTMSTFFQWLIDIFRDVKFWFVVDPWEKAVRVRAGKHTTVLTAGFHWKLPMLDEVYILNTRLRLGPAGSQTITSKDGRIITLGVQFGFSITEPLMALSTYLHPENSLAVLVQNSVADYILNHNLEEMDIPELETYVVTSLKDSDPNNGMVIEFVKVTTFVVSGPARTFRLVNDEIHVDWSTDVKERARWQPNIQQW